MCTYGVAIRQIAQCVILIFPIAAEDARHDCEDASTNEKSATVMIN